MKRKKGDKVKYIGDFDNCHAFVYKITKVWDNCSVLHYDLEMIDFPGLECGGYETIASVLYDEVEDYRGE